MKENKGIVIKNVYYMLAYAFQSLSTDQYRDLQAEKFDQIHDLFAAILSKGIAKQLKQGLHREYVAHVDVIPTLRGKIDMAETVKLRVVRQRRLACEYDELSENNPLNQILKATSFLLIRHGRVKPENRASLKRSMLFFSEVDDIELSAINWSAIVFRRNSQSYRMLIGLCQLLIQEMLLTTAEGEKKLMSFLDDQAMSRLYEKFILEYYARHWPALRPRAAQIPWALDEGERTMLPTMQSDIVLTHANSVLIIDAKFYSRNTQQRFDRHTVHSANVYQIFTYVKNKEAEDPTRVVSGMLLYAKTDHEVQADAEWKIGGSLIEAKTLDLNRDFSAITEQLDGVVSRFFTFSPVARVA